MRFDGRHNKHLDVLIGTLRAIWAMWRDVIFHDRVFSVGVFGGALVRGKTYNGIVYCSGLAESNIPVFPCIRQFLK